MRWKSKFITGYEVTDASVHDSGPTSGLLNKEDEDQDFYADSAYTGEALHKEWTEQKNVKLKIIEKGYKNKPRWLQKLAGQDLLWFLAIFIPSLLYFST